VGRELPLEHFTRNTIVVVSGQLLRATGAKISHRLSWERTAVDLVRQLQVPPFSELKRFRHLIVRFGCSAAVHVFNTPSKSTARIYYDATITAGFLRTPQKDGRVIGFNSVFAARILTAVTEMPREDDEVPAIEHAIRRAIVDCQELYKKGFGASFKDESGFRIDYSAPAEVLFSRTSLND
jgi:hypothetical protein